MQRKQCFEHPGTYMSPAMTRSLKDDCVKLPTTKAALEKLIKETPLTHQCKPLVVVDIGYSGVGQGHAESTKDAEMAVSAALLLWATNNNEYGYMCLKIVKAWSETNKIWRGDNALLEASWVICSMARAAELLKWSPHFTDAWKHSGVEGAFNKWLDTVIMPVLKSEHIWKWSAINNWHFSQICARMQIAIFREDHVEWEWCLRKYREAVNKALVFTKCPGETTETCRDVTHAQMQLGGIAQAAEMAYHQGIKDLYQDRMMDCFELQATIMMKEVPTGFTRDDIKTPYGYWYEPVWHIAYMHFTQRRKKAMPKTEAYIKQLRCDRVCFHWGPNCLTHYQRVCG